MKATEINPGLVVSVSMWIGIVTIAILIMSLLFSCTKEEKENYICRNITVQSIRNHPDIKPDSAISSTYHFLTAEECVILKDINTYSAVGVLYGDTIDIKYTTKCKLAN